MNVILKGPNKTIKPPNVPMRGFVILNKSVIRYLPSCTYHLIYVCKSTFQGLLNKKDIVIAAMERNNIDICCPEDGNINNGVHMKCRKSPKV